MIYYLQVSEVVDGIRQRQQAIGIQNEFLQFAAPMQYKYSKNVLLIKKILLRMNKI
jgi:hypothetical protein